MVNKKNRGFIQAPVSSFTKTEEDLSSTTFSRSKSGAGFTLIELLVVIAIIGMLSAVVLASLNSARGKGADAAVKETLANVRSQAEIVYDDAPGSYAAVCANTAVIRALTGAANATGATVGVTDALQTTTTVACDDAAGSYVIQAPLKSQNLVNGTSAIDYWCVDNNGNSKLEDAPAAAAATACV